MRRKAEEMKAKSTTLVVSDALVAEPVDPVKVQRQNNGTFAPGNTLGFLPGQSGYPQGRPKGIRYISESLNLALVAIGEDGRSVADAIADAVIGQALQGNMKAVEFIAARTDKLSYGKHATTSHFDPPPHVIKHEEEVYAVMEEEECDRTRALKIIDERDAEVVSDVRKAFKKAERLINSGRGREVDFEGADSLVHYVNSLPGSAQAEFQDWYYRLAKKAGYAGGDEWEDEEEDE